MRATFLTHLVIMTGTPLADFPDPRSIPADDRVAYLNRVAHRAGDANAKPHYDRAAATLKSIYDLWPDCEVDSPTERTWEAVADNLSTLAVRSDWTAEEERVVNVWLEANHTALAAIRAATDVEMYFEPLPADEGRLWRALLADALYTLLPAKELIAIRASAFARVNRWDAAIEWNGCLRRLASHMRQQPLLIQSYMGMGFERMAYSQILAWSSENDRKTCSRLLTDLASTRRSDCPAQLTKFAEDLYSLDYLEALHAWARNPEVNPEMQEAVGYALQYREMASDEEVAGLRLGPPFENADALRLALRGSSIDESWCVYLQVKSIYEEWLAKPFHAAWSEVDRFRHKVAKISNTDPAIRYFDSFLDPDQGRYLRSVTDCQRIGAMATLAILDHRTRTGNLPDSLSDLTTEEPKTMTTDIFSGKPFRYRLADSGKDFRLYSVGPDLVDDGGEKVADGKGPGDIVFWPVTLPDRYDRNLDYEQD